jgi:hypothetical protein
MHTEPFLKPSEWTAEVHYRPDSKDLKRASDFLLKPARKDAMFRAIRYSDKLYRRANAFAAAGFDVTKIIEEKVENNPYFSSGYSRWLRDFNIIKEKITMKKFEMLFPD